jgi:hypothetical protein
VVAALLADPARRAAMGEAGRRWIAAERSDGAFAERLASGLSVLNLPTLASDTPGQRPKAVRSTGGGDGEVAGGHE